MEGTLWKWTNYFAGWQPRWFVLDNGILSYYKAQDDVNNGSKGSLKMAVCDVLVHPTDPTRLDLSIPGEQYFYVKAATPKERQMWLVALGSCKACLTEEIVSKPNGTVNSDEADLSVSREDLKSKKSELRLYCDLLMQQVHSVKFSIEQSVPPDVNKLDEATSLLSATCDTFIQTLDEVMLLSQATAQLDTSQHVPDTHDVVQGPLLKKPSSRSNVSSRVTSADSMLQAPGPEHRHVHPPAASSRGKTHMRSLEDMATRTRTPQRNLSRSYSESSENSTREVHRESVEVSDQSDREDKKPVATRVCPTFFSVMSVGFHQICCDEKGGIPVPKFLEACTALAAVFDKLSATAFAPVKMDFTGNVKKIRQKYSTNPQQFSSLQSLVLQEKKAKESTDPNSATQALLWLKRGLEFISIFLQELAAGEEDLPAAAHKAYSKTLKPFHGWVVRGMFGLAMKAAPYKKDFFTHLSISPSHCASPGFLKQLLSDIRSYTDSLDSILVTVNTFYENERLHSSEQV